MNIRIPRESEEQAMLFEWAAMMTPRYPELALLFHIPNGGSRNLLEAVNLKRQGVKAGVPDIFLPVSRMDYHGLFVEMKRQKNSRISESQKDMIGKLQREGYFVHVSYGFDDAKKVITYYLDSKL